jgi:hypothetical protein
MQTTLRFFTFFMSISRLVKWHIKHISSCAFGVKGGDETNLSAYLLAPVNTQNYCLDAGTINAGIEKP